MRTIVAAMLLASTAASSACADEPVSAKTILDEALTSAQLIEASAERASMLLAIGKAQIAAGDPGAAKATLDQALAATKTIGDYLDQATSLAAVADAELQLGDRTIAAAAAAAIDEPVARAKPYGRGHGASCRGRFGRRRGELRTSSRHRRVAGSG